MADNTQDVVEFVVKGLEEVRNAYKDLGILQTKLGATSRDVTTAYNAFTRAVGSSVKAVMQASAAQARFLKEEQKTAQMQEVTKQMKLRYNLARYIIRNTEELTNVEKAWITELLKAANALGKVGSSAKKAQGDIKVFGDVTRDQLAGALNILSSGGGGADAITGLLSALGLVTGQLELALVGIGIKLVSGIANQLGKIPGIIVGVFQKGFDLVKGLVEGFINFLGKITQPIRELFGNILGVFGGLQLSNIVNSFANSLRNMASAAFEGVRAFQKLDIRFETIMARDIAKRMGIPLGQAMELASKKAKELSEWVKVLALQTPFSAEVVAESLALANAYGVSTSMAKKLTSATADFTSAMGLTEDHMYRIIYNFGQMQTQGKLTGREFRDLAISFVPVYDILREMATQSGTTYEEMKKLALTGGVPVKDFFQTFIDMAERDFPGAAAKMSRTLEGLIEKFGDFKKIIIGVSVFGPVMARVSGILSDVFDTLLSTKVRQEFEQLGIVIDRTAEKSIASFEVLSDSVGELMTALGFVKPSFYGFVKAIATAGIFLDLLIRKVTEVVKGITATLDPKMKNTATNMATWGNNMIVKFAAGMAKGVAAIITVINKIMALIAKFFRPQSPPEIAPYIDQWGAKTATLWLQGWLNADFSVFDEFAGTVEDFLRSMPIDYGGDESGLILKILGTRENVAKAIRDYRTGILSLSDALDKIIQAVPDATTEFKQYIAAMFAVEDATKSVSDAQKELDAITALYDERLKALNSELNKVTEEYDEQVRLAEIKEAIDTGLLTQDELARLNAEKRSLELKKQIRTTEEERDIAVEAADDKLTAAQELLTFQQAQLENLKSTIDFQIQQNELLKELFGILQSLSDAGETEDETFSWPEEPEEPGDSVSGALTGGLWDLEQIFEEAQLAAENLFAVLEEALTGSANWQQIFIDLSTNTDAAKESWRIFYEEHIKPFYETEAPLWEIAIGDAKLALEGLAMAITGEPDGATAAVRLLTYASIVGRFFLSLFASTVDTLTFFIGLLRGDTDLMAESFNRLRERTDPLAITVRTFGLIAWVVGSFFGSWWKNTKQVVKYLGELADVINAPLFKAIGGAFDDIRDAVDDAINSLEDLLQLLGIVGRSGTGRNLDIKKSTTDSWSDFNDETEDYVTKSPYSKLSQGLAYANEELLKMANLALPAVQAQFDLMPAGGIMSAAPVTNIGGATYNIDRSTHIQMNPSYANTQSEAGVYYDVTAALVAARM